MAPKPFTYEHFIQAVQSLKDDKLMYYIDEAVAIYCKIKGKSVGPRPASSKDYLPEYADAFEAANYAIFITANKIGAYNPDKGAFRPYLGKALESALRDIFRADGYETLSGSSEIENEPDTSASDAEERVRQHKDDAFETMIKFIDALPEIKRAAIYASAFGQILRPDLEGYGRNYADILAEIYHTTALYIRQLATEGKKAALAEARRQGFNESSMNEVYMGMLQVQSPARDINDEVIQATEKLSPYQQFMLLRHLAGVNATSNSSTNIMSFEYQTEGNAILLPLQKKILEKIEDFTPFPYADLTNFRELRQRTGLRVIISDRHCLCQILDDCIKRIEDTIADYGKQGLWKNACFGANVENEIYRRLKWAKEQRVIAENPLEGKIPLLGLYTRKLLWFDSASPAVYLFSDNIKDYAEHKSMPTEHVFSFVFIHELMHAYYDAFFSFGFPAKEQLEEAFAEFGMLTFIERAYGTTSKLFVHAQRSVADKIEFGPREYGFGFTLYEKSYGKRTDMINTYKRISNWIDSSVLYKDFPNKGLGNYFIDIVNYTQEPNENNSDQCFNDVQAILEYHWQSPSLRPQENISTRSVFTTSPVKPNPFFHSPLTVCQPRQGISQHTIIRETDIEDFVAVIIRLLKLVGVESKLSFIRSLIAYSGERLFFYSQTTSPQSRRLSAREVIIPESLCINGLTVYPKCRLSTGLCTKLVCILSDIVGTEFYFMSGSYGKEYALYGPELCREFKDILFEKEKRCDKCSYDISLKSTSEVIGRHEHMSRVPLVVMKHFCDTNKDITWRDIQEIFDRIYCPSMGPFLDWITPKSIVDAVSAFYNQKTTSFHQTPVILGSGENLLVTRRWAFMPDAFTAFLKVADSLGYDIQKT